MTAIAIIFLALGTASARPDTHRPPGAGSGLPDTSRPGQIMAGARGYLANADNMGIVIGGRARGEIT
jgi:hypothetical protein